MTIPINPDKRKLFLLKTPNILFGVV